MAGVETGQGPVAGDRPSVRPDAPQQMLVKEALSWSHGLSAGRRKQHLWSAVQIAGSVFVTSFAIVGAYLMHYGWPPSLGQVRESAYGVLPVVTAAFRIVVAPEFNRFLLLFVLSPVVYGLALRWNRLYEHTTGGIRPFADSLAIFKASLAGSVALFMVHVALLGGPVGTDFQDTMLFTAYAAALVFWGMLLFHSGALIGVLGLRSFGIGLTRLAVIAPDEQIRALRKELETPGSRYTFVGVLDPGGSGPGPDTPPQSHLGAVEDIEDIINRHYVDEIIIGMDLAGFTPEERLHVVRTCWKLGADLRVVSPFHPYFETGGKTEMLGDIPLLRMERSGLYTTGSQFLKRTMDLVLSLTALITAAPLLLGVAVLVKCTSRGPILFIQERPGLHGRVFRILKFRSMYADADHSHHREAQRRLIENGEAAEVDKKGKGIYGKVAADPRITPVGLFIRRTSIDELPQLYNVLRGEMSLVGPRPAVLGDVKVFKEWHLRRHDIRPGITGLWQVSGRSRLSFDDMVKLDLKYIEEWSIGLDLRILLKTIPVLLRIDQAY